VLKLNDSELPVLARFCGRTDLPDKAQLEEIASRYSLRLIVFTRGALGSMLYDSAHWSEHPGIEVEVKDTVGAGDAFTAAVALGLLAGWDLRTIGNRATALAAHVCACEGATPPVPPHLRAPFNNVASSRRG